MVQGLTALSRMSPKTSYLLTGSEGRSCCIGGGVGGGLDAGGSFPEMRAAFHSRTMVCRPTVARIETENNSSVKRESGLSGGFGS